MTTETKEIEEITRDPRPEKVALVKELKSLFETSQGVVFTEYRGLDVSSMKELRMALKSVGASYKIYKNTLVRRAVAELELQDMFAELLKGPVGLAFVETDADYSATARTLAEYKKTNNVLILKAGYTNGELMDEAQYEVFSKLPPLEVLRAQLASALKYTLSNFAGLINAPLQKLAGQLDALRQKLEAEQPAQEQPTEQPAQEQPTEQQSEEQTAEQNAQGIKEEIKVEEEEIPAEENSEAGEPS